MVRINRFNGALLFAGIILVLGLVGGYELSLRRPLWNDEIYTQVSVIDQRSYSDIAFLRIKRLEGNSCPLFYLIQKGVSDVFGFRFPFQWQFEWAMDEPGSQVIMRLSSNFFMSLSIALLVYFFSRYYSLATGAYALLVTLSSFLVWAYYVEARPYALWFFLTTCQLLVYLSLLKDKQNSSLWRRLTVIHWLLALTLILSAIQIVIVSFLLWLFADKSLKKYLGATLVPMGLCAYYYSQSMLYGYTLVQPLQLIFRNIPPDSILFFIAYFLFWAVYNWQKKRGKALPYPSDAFAQGGTFGPALALMLIAASLLLTIMYLRQGGPGFTSLSERYFIYLTPVGIIAIVLFSFDLVKAYRWNLWMLTNIIITLAGLMILRFLRTYKDIFGI